MAAAALRGNRIHAGQRGNPARRVSPICWMPKMAKVLVLGVVLAVFQQWCGINVIFNYAEEIFKGGRLRHFERAEQHRLDRLGEPGVHLRGAGRGGPRRAAAADAVRRGGAGGDLHGDGLLLHDGVKGLPMLLLVLAAIGCYAMSLAPVTWVVISEIFPNRIRGAAMSVAVCALWIACFILTYTFPMLKAKLGRGGHVLALRGDLRAGFYFHQIQTAGNQRQNPGTNRAGHQQFAVDAINRLAGAWFACSAAVNQDLPYIRVRNCVGPNIIAVFVGGAHVCVRPTPVSSRWRAGRSH